LHFRFYPLRFEFIAQETLFFPPGKAANILRGALGVIFRKIACAPQCPGAQDCGLRGSCPYARVFEPSATGDGPSGLSDWPRPFVFRAAHLDGRLILAGEPFWFDLHVFSLDPAVLEYFVLTFASLAREGLGPRRGKAELQRVTTQGVPGSQLLYDTSTGSLSNAVEPKTPEPMTLDLTPAAPPGSVTRIRVEFLTPTELKHEDKIARAPEFRILFARIRDRVSMLSRLYAAVTLDIDYAGTNSRAARIKMTACHGRHSETTRHSTKTGRTHSLGGFVGEAEYEGDLAEFLPFLEAGRWTGVGRQSVWGKGEIRTYL
jgi:hypothetical protein